MSRAGVAPRSTCAFALAAGLIALTFLLGCFELWDTDVYWHLATGRLIWERAEVPRQDWFTYTNALAPWIDLHWLFQLALAGLHALGGVPLLVLAKAAAGAATVGVALAARQRGWPLSAATALWVAPAILFTGRLYERPELCSTLGLAVFALVLFHADRRPRWIWALPAVQLLWVNTHGLFILGPLVLTFFWIDHALAAGCGAVGERWLIPPSGVGGARPRAAQLVGPSLTTLAACLANPYFEQGALFPLELLAKISGGDDFYRRHVDELQGVGDFLLHHGVRNPYAALFLATLLLSGFSFVVLSCVGRRGSPFRLLFFAAFAYLGWQAKRNSGLFALAAGLTMVANVSDALTVWRQRRPAPPRAPTSRRVHVARWTLAALLASLAWLVVTNRFYDWAGEGRRFGLSERRGWFAHDACRFLGRPGMPERALVYDLGQAAVYIFHNGPSRQVFADPRLEVNSRQVIERYLAIGRTLARGDPSWERLIAPPPGPNHARAWPALLLDTASSRPLIARLLADGRWRCVYADRVATVFLRAEQANALGLAALPLGQASTRPPG